MLRKDLDKGCTCLHPFPLTLVWFQEYWNQYFLFGLVMIHLQLLIVGGLFGFHPKLTFAISSPTPNTPYRPLQTPLKDMKILKSSASAIWPKGNVRKFPLFRHSKYVKCGLLHKNDAGPQRIMFNLWIKCLILDVMWSCHCFYDEPPLLIWFLPIIMSLPTHVEVYLGCDNSS